MLTLSFLSTDRCGVEHHPFTVEHQHRPSERSEEGGVPAGAAHMTIENGAGGLIILPL